MSRLRFGLEFSTGLVMSSPNPPLVKLLKREQKPAPSREASASSESPEKIDAPKSQAEKELLYESV